MDRETSLELSIYVETYHERIYVSVQTICLPPSGLHIRGDEAAAVGWGRYLPNFVRKRRGLPSGSKTLRYVRLRVSDRPFRNEKMFGTLIPEDATHENVKDACAGDSGGFKHKFWQIIKLINI